MGYTKTIPYRGLTVQDAYHRIDTTISSNEICTAIVNIYVSRKMFLDGEGYIEQMTVEYPLSYGTSVGDNKNQGYEYLLSLPENVDAVPVFEDGQPN